jgi:hypothetical protein
MDVNTKFNYYDILEVSPHCAQQEVTTAYERLKMTYGGENPAIYTIFSEDEAREMLGLVEEAFAVLGNKSLRTSYDEKMSLTVGKPNSVDKQSARMKGLDIPKKNAFSKPTYDTNEELEKEIRSCQDWSGEMLKKVRVYKNWKVDALAELTKISGFYITAIECIEPKNLPAPVFVRGYVAQLSRVLGLEEKVVCDSYMKHFKSKLE